MDLIYTNAALVDQGVLSAYSFDLSYGAKENDFEISLGAGEPVLEFGAMIYMEGTEYGGTIDAMNTSTESETITYKGRTWHGMLNSKVVQPDTGADYLIVSGDANEIIAMLIERLGLGSLFAAEEEPSGVNISKYQFHRYCLAYDGLRDMLADNGAKLKIVWENRYVKLYAEPISDFTDDPVDGDTATLTVEQYGQKVNHLVCLGSGNLAQREVLHLYADQFGQIIDTPYYTGLDEVMDVYDYGNAESSEELRKEGITHIKELRQADNAQISVLETDGLAYDIGDIVGAKDTRTGVSVAAAVAQKIVRISNGAVSTEYQTGGE